QAPAFAGMEADFYVSPAGNDSWLGTLPAANATHSNGPFKTLTKARDAVRSKLAGMDRDIVVTLRGGSYFLDKTIVFRLVDSGKDDFKVIYRNYPGEEPVFSPGVKVTGWKKVEKGLAGLPAVAKGRVWVADVPKKLGRFFTLYEGSKRLPRARSKAFAPTKYYDFTNEGVPFTADYEWPVRDTLHFPKGVLKNWPNLEDVEIVIRPHNEWVLNILTLKSVDEASLTAKTTIEGTYALGSLIKRHRDSARSCWVENVFEALDEPGEWVLNMQERKVYLWPIGSKPGEDILAPCLKELIRVEGRIDYDGPVDEPVRNLVFKGLKFTHGDRDTWTKDDKGIQHDWEMFDKDSALVRLRGAENCTIEECEFSNSGGTGIRLDLHCQYNLIKNNLLENLGAVGILLSGYGPGSKDVNKYNQILNNCVHDCGQIYWHSLGILAWQSGENRIANNLVYNLPYDGIGLTGCRPHFFKAPFKGRWREVSSTIRFDEVGDATEWDAIMPFLHCRSNIVEDNELHNVMKILGDGNAIYSSAAGPFNIIRRNYIHHVQNSNGMIRTDGWQKDTLICENIIYKASAGIQRKNYNHIENNIFADISEGGRYIMFVSFPDEKRTTVGSRFKRNIFYDCGRNPDFYFVGKPPAGRAPTYPEHCQADYNLFYCKGDPEAGSDFIKKMRAEKNIEEHSISADPLFVDVENGDLRLRPDSPALKLGFKPIDIAKIGLTKDFPQKFRLGIESIKK
ncbi:MAG: right-handed parallel beta-helix repeat-containing protein, partial [Planctomycetota bacterium]